MPGSDAPLRTRLLPALLSALGVTLLAAGLMTYGDPLAADPSATGGSSPSPTTAAVVSPSPRITLPPIGSASPDPTTALPTPPADRVATRVRIEALDIDLPVIRGPDGYPPCDVAMYLKELSQPGFGKATYLYAHARTGMFLALLETKSRQQRGSVVEVWTSDDVRFTYEITEVRRGQTSLDDPLSATTEELWLQTSEGPKGTVGKTQVLARFLDSTPADPADAHPKARPIDCG